MTHTKTQRHKAKAEPADLFVSSCLRVRPQKRIVSKVVMNLLSQVTRLESTPTRRESAPIVVLVA
jgi:hypothetical protein